MILVVGTVALLILQGPFGLIEGFSAGQYTSIGGTAVTELAHCCSPVEETTMTVRLVL